MSVEQLRERILTTDGSDFAELALLVFQHQATHNPTYRRYLELIDRPAAAVVSERDLPFLPIQFFKNQNVRTGTWTPVDTFTSSGTTGGTTARHPVRDVAFYRQNTARNFTAAYGRPPEDFCWLALLPSYLERTGSSLILMAEHFIAQSRYSESGFFLNDYRTLLDRLAACQRAGIPTVLLGVSFALWELAERFAPDLSGVVVMETGGMKGRRREVTRAELHQILRRAFRVEQIHSEYGATELFSQSYSRGGGVFRPSPTLRVYTREVTDPLRLRHDARTGALNLIDLANVDTVSFLATDDLGRVFDDGCFEVLGRMDASDVRGCNLLIGENR